MSAACGALVVFIKNLTYIQERMAFIPHYSTFPSKTGSHCGSSSQFFSTKATGTTKPPLPEQSLIRLNLIIAPIFVLSRRAQLQGIAVVLDCHALWVISPMLPFMARIRLVEAAKVFHRHRLGVTDNCSTSYQCFFLSSAPHFCPSLLFKSLSVPSMCRLRGDALGCLCFNRQPFMSGC